MFELTVRQKIAALVLTIFLVIGGLLVFLAGNRGVSKEFQADISEDKIYVQFSGAVMKPGIIALKPGTRKFEALEKVGGALPEADLNRVNLAEFIEDGEQVYIPKKGEEVPTLTKKRSTSKNNRKIKDLEETAMKETKVQPKPKLTGPVDINSASQTQLEGISGIGPFLAQKIIEYRNKHGNFQSFEDLDKVYGIGPSKLEKLRPFLCVK